MRIIDNWRYLALSCLLFIGYLLVEKNILLSLSIWKGVSLNDFPYTWESVGQAYQYTAINIFAPGYVKEEGSVFHNRALTYPQNAPLEDGHLIIKARSSEGGAVFSLPKGFNNGVLRFRVRAKTDKDGKITEAKYGKIYGDIEFAPLKPNKTRLSFTYYFNPTGTRNLEFDPNQNLLKGLTNIESPYEP